jgi:hypothetical protein
MKEKHRKTVFSFKKTQFKSFHANQPLFWDALDVMISNHGPFEAVLLCRLPKHPGYFAVCIYQLFMIVCWKVLSTKHATNSSANSRAITGRLPVNRYLPLLLKAPLVFVAPFILRIATLVFFFTIISIFLSH